MMKDRDLEYMHSRLFGERTRATDTCPSPALLVALVAGELDGARRARIERDVHACPECTQEVERLREAQEWFAERQRVEYGASGGPEPLPGATSGARRLPDRVVRLADAAADVVRRATEEVTRRLSELANWMQPRSLGALEGLRGGAGQVVQGTCIAAGGAQTGGSGAPLEIPLLRAEIESDGRLVLSFATGGTVPPSATHLQAYLAVEGLSLALPAKALRASKETTILVMLPGARRVAAIPSAAIRVEVLVPSDGVSTDGNDEST